MTLNPAASSIKLFSVIIISYSVCTLIHFQPVLTFVARLEACQSGAQLKWRAPSLATNIRLEWKWMADARTLAYYFMGSIMAVKSFIV